MSVDLSIDLSVDLSFKPMFELLIDLSVDVAVVFVETEERVGDRGHPPVRDADQPHAAGNPPDQIVFNANPSVGHDHFIITFGL